MTNCDERNYVIIDPNAGNATQTMEYSPMPKRCICRSTVGPFSQRMNRLKLLCDEVVETIPTELMHMLHGGISLTEKSKLHPASIPDNPLYVLGEYCRSAATGRYIMLYGGSILRTYGDYDDEKLKEELNRIIRHELTHHWESLSGTAELEVLDSISIERYKNENN